MDKNLKTRIFILMSVAFPCLFDQKLEKPWLRWLMLLMITEMAPLLCRADKKFVICSFNCPPPRKSLVKGERFVRSEGRPELVEKCRAPQIDRPNNNCYYLRDQILLRMRLRHWCYTTSFGLHTY